MSAGLTQVQTLLLSSQEIFHDSHATEKLMCPKTRILHSPVPVVLGTAELMNALLNAGDAGVGVINGSYFLCCDLECSLIITLE